jgi:tripartite-type tricarboxylate transporter receptor subunit TctC
MKTFRAMSRLIAFFASIATFNPASADKAWPSQPIRVIVPIGAGSAIDIIPRTILDEVSKQLGQTIVVENRPGAGTAIGTLAVTKAAPDGYTLLSTSGALTIAEVILGKPQFKSARDLVGISAYGTMPNVLVVAPSKKFNSLKDLVEKGKTNPGTLTYSTAGAGTPSHFNALRFMASAGFEALQIPFKGAADAMTEVMTGRVDFYFVPLLPALPLIKEGKLLPLAVSGSKRSELLPEVPTTVESGYPNSEYDFWIGMLAPAKTDKVIIDRLHQEISAAMKKQEVQTKLKGYGLEVGELTQAEFNQMLKDEVERNARLMKSVGDSSK